MTILEGLDEAQAELLRSAGRMICCGRGVHVIRRGSDSRSVYTILSGEVEIRDRGTVVAKLGKGEVFGEMNFFLGEERTADVISVDEDTAVVCYDERDLRKLALRDSDLAIRLLSNIARILCTRLRALQQKTQGAAVHD